MPSSQTLDGDRPVTKQKPILRGWIHLGMFVVALVAGPLLIAQAPTLGATLVLTIYVLSVVALFGISAAFHRKDWSPDARRWMRRADHSAIFVAIAGTYTAVAGLALEGWAKLFVLCLVWAGAATGIVLRQVWLDAPKWVVALPAIVVGWSALAVVPQLVRAVGSVGFVLILVGGIFYTVGALVYALRWPDPIPHVFGYHEVFHACTVVGATLQFIAIAGYALPRA